MFDRYHIVDTEDVVDAMRRLQNGENTVKTLRPGRQDVKALVFKLLGDRPMVGLQILDLAI